MPCFPDRPIRRPAAWLATLLLTALLGIPLSARDSLMVTFRLTGPPGATPAIAGSFNGWQADSSHTVRDDGEWVIRLTLPEGYHQYKLVVDGHWIADPTNPLRINDGGEGENSIVKVGNPAAPIRKTAATAAPLDSLPRPILPAHPEWVALYDRAWELAWAHIDSGTAVNGFAPRYLDEGFNELIYQWDTCFMAAFAVYGHPWFPAMEGLDNFYSRQREDGYIQRVYRETDGGLVHEPTSSEPMVNPPLFAWLEWRWLVITGDDSRVDRVLPVLIRYFDWIEANLRAPEGRGLYYSTPLGSGMDNLPRPGVGRGGYVDLTAQQALAARAIAALAEYRGDMATATAFRRKQVAIRDLLSRHCWNPEAGFFQDFTAHGHPAGVDHIGAFWTLLADVATPQQGEALLVRLQDPMAFWRRHPVPALSAAHPFFDPRGHYWRGGVWAPTNYMVVRGLERHGRADLAEAIATNHIDAMSRIYREFRPDSGDIAFEERFADGYHTIWESYAPDTLTPATRWDGTFYARQDFVGWSGLGPIAMLIETILGVDVQGLHNRIRWRVRDAEVHGIRGLRLRDQRVHLLAEPDGSGGMRVIASADGPFDLLLKQGRREWLHRLSGSDTLAIPPAARLPE